MTFKERVEANAVLWLLGCLLTGFLAGISTYRAVQEMAGLEPVSKADYDDLQTRANQAETQVKLLQAQLDQPKSDARPHPTASISPGTGTATHPQLRGVSIRIWYPKASAAQAAEIADKLERLGMAVKLSPHEQKVDQSLNSVYYFKNGYSGPAAQVAAVLRDYGFQSTRFDSSTESTDLVLWLWPH